MQQNKKYKKYQYCSNGPVSFRSIEADHFMLYFKDIKKNDKDFRKEDGTMMNYKSTAKQIVKAVGGKKNIQKAGQCMTRLRFELKDENKIDHEALKHMNGIVASFMQGKEYQIFPKEGVNELYAQITKPSVGEKIFGDFW